MILEKELDHGHTCTVQSSLEPTTSSLLTTITYTWYNQLGLLPLQVGVHLHAIQIMTEEKLILMII